MAVEPKARKPGPKVLSSAPSRSVDVSGLRVHYKKVGASGPALLFVHGWACDLTFWRHQAERFHEEATLLCARVAVRAGDATVLLRALTGRATLPEKFSVV